MGNARFRLQPVLNYREQLVEMRQQELGVLEHSLWEQKELLATMEAAIRDLEQDIQRAQGMGNLDCEGLLRQFIYLQHVRGCAEEQRARVAELTGQVAAKRDELLQAAQAKQTLEKLKERQCAQDKIEEIRHDGQILDEIGVMRYYRQNQFEENQ